MKQLLYLFLFCFPICLVNAQRNYTHSEILKVEDSIYRNLENDLDLASKLANEITTGTLNNRKSDSLNIFGYFLKSVVYFHSNKPDLAKASIDRAFEYFINNPSLIQKYLKLYIEVSCTIAFTEEEYGNYNIASEIAYKCLNEIGNKSEYNYEKSRLLYLLGHICFEIGNYDKAKKLLHESIKYTYKTENKIRTVIRATSRETLGNIYSETNLDSAYYYYNKAKDYYNSEIYKSRPYYSMLNIIARLDIKKGELNNAKAKLKKVAQFEASQEIKELEYYYLAQIEIASIEGDINKEYGYLKILDSLSKNKNYSDLNIELHNRYASYYSKTKNFEMLNKHKILAKKFTDSLYDKNKMFAVNELELKYKTGLKDSELKAKEEQLKLKSKQQKRLIAVFSIVLILLGLSALFYFQKQKTEKKLSNEKITSMLESQKLNAVKSQLIGQNLERERIAKDLHDSVSGNIAAIKLKLSQIETQTIDIQNLTNDLDKTYKEVRSISHDLIPKDILKEGYVSLLEQLIDTRKAKDLTIEIEYVTEESINNLSEKIQLELYTILKELLTNIQKHAEASMVFINLIHHETNLSVTVEDNGKGFNVNNEFEGIGIKNINSRLKTINGFMEIESSIGNGSYINMEINLA